MPEFSVRVRTDVPLHLAAVGPLVDALADLHAAVGQDDAGRVGVLLTVDADDMVEAFTDAATAVLRALEDVDDVHAAGTIVGVEVLTAAEFDREQEALNDANAAALAARS